MTMLEKLKDSYGKLSNEFAYFYTNGMHYEDDGDEIYELRFEWFALGDTDSFAYIFGINGDPCGDKVQMEHAELWYYSVAQLNVISDFAKLFNEARADKETVLKFIDYLEEHKEVRFDYLEKRKEEKPKYYTVKEMNDVEKLEICDLK